VTTTARLAASIVKTVSRNSWRRLMEKRREEKRREA
jgi:hypothetical protein